MHNKLKHIVAHFVPGRIVGLERFGSGLINDTYLCEMDDLGATRRYILQRINTAVFKHPEQVMLNVETVTRHVRSKLMQEGVADPDAISPALIFGKNGQSFLRDDAGSYWRMFPFIEKGEVFDQVTDSGHAFEIGKGLGRFHALVSDLVPDGLADTLPGFHHTDRYLAEYDAALLADARGRAAEIGTEIDFVLARRNLASLLTSRIAANELPIRVVHNDPKVNNIMLDRATGKALCMLDLDTVKPGTVLFDFGDCVRSAANPTGEDAPDLESVNVDRGLYQAITQGYLEEAGGFLTKQELDLLPLSVQVITFELGLRFLTDYLAGDVYFKTRYAAHNLHRCRVQFRLLASIEASF